VNGHQPQAFDSQRLQVIELLGDAVEIADAVAVAVAKRTDKDLIENRVVPPGERLCADDRCACSAVDGSVASRQSE
jgi:hypothetical protein